MLSIFLKIEDFVKKMRRMQNQDHKLKIDYVHFNWKYFIQYNVQPDDCTHFEDIHEWLQRQREEKNEWS